MRAPLRRAREAVLSDPVVVEFTYARDEYIRAVRRHYQSALNLRRDSVAGVLGVIGGLCLAFAMDVGWIAWVLVVAGAALLLLVLYLTFFLPSVIYRSEPKLKSQYRLAFSDECIHFTTNEIDSTLHWSLYQSWRSDAEFYVLYYGKRQFTVIPRRVLSAADDAQLRELLERNIGSEST